MYLTNMIRIFNSKRVKIEILLQNIEQNTNLDIKQIRMDFIRFEPFCYVHYKRSKYIILNLNIIKNTLKRS